MEELTKKGTLRKRKPKQKIYYFIKDTEDAILKYVTLTDQREKNKLYNEKINYAFFKLTQNIINTYKFPYMDGSTEDKQQEVLFHLLKSLHKYNPDKGMAYSYFGTAALRYCIYENNKNYKIIKSIDSIDTDELNEELFNNLNYEYEYEYDINDNYILSKFILFVELNIEDIFIKKIKNKSKKTELQEIEDIKTVFSILEIFKQKENIDIFNKKAILLYIREQTNQTTNQITKISKKLNNIYKLLNDFYYNNGYIPLNINIYNKV
jgi:hypothetical protein